MKVCELLEKRCEYPSTEELRARVRRHIRERGNAFEQDLDRIYQVFKYYWHAADRWKIIETLVDCMMDTTARDGTLEILDVGSGRGELTLDVMRSLLARTRKLPVADIVEPAEKALDMAMELLPHDEAGGFLRDAFSHVEETGDRTYDVIFLNNSIYFFEPFEESVVYFLRKIRKGGAILILYAVKNLDYGELIGDIRTRCEISNETTLFTLPLRLFLGDKEIYSAGMIRILKDFYLQNAAFCANPLSDRLFIETLAECSEDGFFDYEHRLLVIRG
uniref:Methyltransferase domain-containing protein n=1 Tax=Candidatus Kentrum sp. FW TaxID=2126338 RepID=A0A450U118_9GAMM|nr:MAG: hypothetical protein BECKFW1821C_GA0114237_10949 [Candidatus Kentron sp. FW]